MRGCEVDGKTFCITGTLRVPRKEVVDLLHQVGGLFHSSVCVGTNFLVLGTKPGATKLRAARKTSWVRVINEDQFWEMLPKSLRPSQRGADLLDDGILLDSPEVPSRAASTKSGSRRLSWED